MRRLDLLQNAVYVITQCAHYHKMRKLLQNASLLQNAAEQRTFLRLICFDCISGGVPYPTLTNRELCKLLKTGYRMEKPDMCCDEA